jgi:allantoicase
MIGSDQISYIKEVVLDASFFTKALYELEIKMSKCGVSRSASTLVTSFAKEWMRIMGLKSLGNSAASFFEISVNRAPLSLYKGLVV